MAGTYLNTVYLTNYQTQNPFTVTSSGLVSVTSGHAVIGTAGYGWTLSNQGTALSTSLPDDQYAWNVIAGSWDSPSNWQDVTTGANPASVAPGANDAVTIAAASGVTDVISGVGNSLSLALSGSVDMAGQFATGSLALTNPSNHAVATLILNTSDTLSVSGNASTDTGATLNLSGGALTVGGNLSYGYNGSQGGSTNVSGGTLSISGNVTANQTGFFVSGGGTFSVSGNIADAYYYSNYTINGGTFTVGGTLTSKSTSISATNSGYVQLANLADGGLGEAYSINLGVDGTSSIEIGTAGGATAGTVTVDAGVTVTETGYVTAPNIVDNGTLVIAAPQQDGSGALYAFLSLTAASGGTGLKGSGQVQIGNSATLTIGAVDPGSQNTIAFTGTSGILNISATSLNTSKAFIPTISGFSPSDVIDYGGTVTSASYSGGVLSLLNGTQTVATLNLSGTFTQGSFHAIALNSSTTEIALSRIISGSYPQTVTLSNPAYGNSAIVTATGRITAALGDGVDTGASVLGTLANYGTVTATASGSRGVYLSAGGVVTNSGGGSAVGTVSTSAGGLITGSAVGVDIAGSIGEVANFATITGGTGIIVGGGATVTNSGTITGTAGTAVALAGGSDRLIVDPGAVFSGILDGGHGSSVLEIAAVSGLGSSAPAGGLGASDIYGTVRLGSAVNFTSLQIDNSATLDGSGVLSFDTLTNQGVVNVASDDSLAFGIVASAASTGTIDLFAGGRVTFKGAVASQALDFKTAGGIAEIDDPNEFGGTIFGFTGADKIDLATVAFDSLGTVRLGANNQLQITENGATYDLQLDPSQDFTGNLFQLTDDGLGGTDIVTPCYCRGTLILTERGEVPVEELAVGDRVRTLSGALKPIVWIGFGRDLVTRGNRLARPVIVRRGALADEVPKRDLYLTHGHALYLDGALIPVENLVNHRSILWDESARVVEYYHIELVDHDVVFAEGAPAETYHDAGNRALFQNAREGSATGAAQPTFAPVLQEGEIVENAWAALFARAGGQVATATTGDPDLHLLVDGERLDPVTAEDGVYRFAVTRPANATLRFCSRSAVPSLLGLGRSDHRRLGVPVGRIVLWHAGIATSFEHDAPQLREGGCHPAEDGYCWTDGELALPARFFTLLNSTFTLAVLTRRHCMRYPITPALAAA